LIHEGTFLTNLGSVEIREFHELHKQRNRRTHLTGSLEMIYVARSNGMQVAGVRVPVEAVVSSISTNAGLVLVDTVTF